MISQSARRLILGTAAASAIAFAVTLGTAGAAPAPIEAMDGSAASIDANSDGIVTAAEHAGFTFAAFLSMDTSEDRIVDKAEFLGWDLGFAHIAEGIGRGDAYAQVKADVFAVWDADGDGAISVSEARAQAAAEFSNSDADADGAAVARDLATGSPTFAAMLTAVRL